MISFPIFGFHRLIAGEEQGGRFELPMDDFERQLSLLKQENFRTVSLDQLHESSERERVKSGWGRSVMLTFDDGYSSDLLLATPLLRKYDFGAIFFVTAALVGTPGYLTRGQVRELCDSGMEIQSHSYNHYFLSQLTPEEMQNELRESRRMLAEITGGDVEYISVPGGRYSREVIREAKKAGYRGVFTSVPGYSHRVTEGMLLLKRFIFENRTPLAVFAGIARQQRTLMLRQRFIYELKRLVRRLLRRP